jgi:hypothetical protein
MLSEYNKHSARNVQTCAESHEPESLQLPSASFLFQLLPSFERSIFYSIQVFQLRKFAQYCIQNSTAQFSTLLCLRCVAAMWS